MQAPRVQLSFDGGTVVVTGPDAGLLASLPGCRLDPRTGAHRTEAINYRAVVEHLRRADIAYEDAARQYQPQ
jgi:hypothetical protein